MMSLLRWLLFPVSLLYTLAVLVRNKIYDWKILSSKQYSVDTVVIGNLAVGGSGKSPMTEYLIRWLKPSRQIATLSRGYGRKSKGFRIVKTDDTAEISGDEPLQFKRKFPNITVAVCEDRRQGIENLMTTHDLILLDDAFQHRRVSAKCNILLFDYENIQKFSVLLPTGNYRDTMNQTRRADIIVITKSPSHIPSEIKKKIIHRIHRYKKAPVFFSSIVYDQCVSEDGTALPKISDHHLLLVTGIANPKPLLNYLDTEGAKYTHIQFADHYPFKNQDYEEIIRRFDQISEKAKIILVTEKDMQRLDRNKFSELPLFYLPIRFALDDEHTFQETVINTLSSANVNKH